MVDQGAGRLDRPLHDTPHVQPRRMQADLPAGEAGDLQQVVDEVGQLPHLPLDDAAGLLLDQVLLPLEPEEMHGVEDGGQGVAELVREHCQELVLATMQVGQRRRLRPGLALHPAPLRDVPDVALGHPPVAHRVEVADELDLHLLPALGPQGEVLVADVALRQELPVGGQARLLVVEQADLPELLAQEVLELVAEQPAHERVSLDDRPEGDVEDQDAVLGRLEQATEPQLGVPERGVRPLSLGGILNGQEDQVRVLALGREAAGIEQHAPPPDLREVVLNLVVVDGDLRGDRLLQQGPKGGDVPLAVAELVEEPADRLLARRVERLEEGGIGPQDPKAAVEDQERLPERRHDLRGVAECLLRLPLVPPAFGAVAEDQDDPGDLARIVADRGGTVFDRSLGPVPGDEQAVIGQPDDCPIPQGVGGGVLGGPPSPFVEDADDGLERDAHRLGLRPAGQRLGGRVQEGDGANGIGGDDGVADAGERDAEPLPLFQQGRAVCRPVGRLLIEVCGHAPSGFAGRPGRPPRL